MSRGSIITFYSYKGGTGRSMALANVACVLAERGHSVLMIDWDLEAPGLHLFFRHLLPGAWGPAAEESLSDSPGLIDMFREVSEALKAPRWAGPERDPYDGGPLPGGVRPEDYFLSTDIPGLHLLKAGRFDQDYQRRVGEFKWREMFERSPFLFGAFAGELARNFDYVLIDARTGITDIGGISTMLMPDKLVAVFTPSLQSLSGLLHLIRNAAEHRRESYDARPLVAFPLPSRVEASEARLRQEWRYGVPGLEGYQPLFEKLFGKIYHEDRVNLDAYFDEVQIPHVPRYAYGESVAVLTERSQDRFSLARIYSNFADILVNHHAPWHYRR